MLSAATVKTTNAFVAVVSSANRGMQLQVHLSEGCLATL